MNILFKNLRKKFDILTSFFKSRHDSDPSKQNVALNCIKWFKFAKIFKEFFVKASLFIILPYSFPCKIFAKITIIFEQKRWTPK